MILTMKAWMIQSSKRYSVVLFILYVTMVFGNEVRDGSEDYSITQWVTKDGLPQSSVTSIQQTSDGYMWIGTFNGLVRFDGIQFTTYNIENTEQLKSDYITYLQALPDGSLWVGTFGGGLLKLENNVLQNVDLGSEDNRETIVSIIKIPRISDNVFVLTSLALFEVSRDSARQVLELPTESGAFSNIGYNPEGELWIEVSNWNLYKILDNWELEFFPKNIPELKRVSTSVNGVGVFDNNTNQLEYISLNGNDENLELNYFPFVQYVRTEDEVWFGGGGQPFTRVDSKGDRYTFNTEPFVSYPDVIALFVDDFGNTWVGMDGGGLARLKKKSVRAVSARDQLPSNNVVSAFIDAQGTLWTGHYGVSPGVYGLKLENGEPTEVGKWIGVPASSFVESSKGGIWMGTMGMRFMRLKDGVVSHLTEREHYGLGTPFQFVRALYEDDNGGLWIGSEKHGVKYWYENQIRYYNTDNGLSNNRIHAIKEDQEGNIWVGSADGLNRIRTDGSIDIYREAEGLGVNTIHCIYLSNDGVLCVGTAGGGLSFRVGNKFVTLKTRNGLLNGVVAQMVEDDQGFLWVGTNRGICRIAWADLKSFMRGESEFVRSMRFGIEDGMLSEECGGGFQPGCVKAPDGSLWFTTVGGLVNIDPSSVVASKPPPGVFVESVIVDNQLVLENIQASGQDNEVNVFSNYENLEIHYTGLDFRSPSDVVFKYKLEGYDNDWIAAGRRRTAFYSHLPPGKYRFRLSAANDLSLYSESSSSLMIVVHPAWWQRKDFQISAAILLFMVILFFYRRQLNRLKYEKEFKADYAKQLILYQEKERQRISRELHDGLGQSLLAIKNRSGLALIEDRDQENRLENAVTGHFLEITKMAGDALNEVRQISHDLRPLQVDRLGLKRSIESIANQVAHSSDLILDLQVEDLDELFSGEEQTNIWRIAQETLNNIIKHAHASEVEISFYRSGKHAYLVIHDDGKGIALKNNATFSSGLGLRSIQERADILKAQVEILSKPGEGLTLRLKIPIQG